MWLTRFAIKQPTIVTLFFLAIALFGTVGYFSMGKNIIPNVAFPIVTVSASYPGASPEEIERLVIRPIEDQIQSIRHLDKVSATAVDGSGTIVVQFKMGTDIDAGANDVTQAVNAARATLPSDLDPPVIDKVDVTAQPILIEAITSKTIKPSALSDLIVNEIEPALRGTKGVGNVQIAGNYAREFHVEPDAGRLLTLGLTLEDVNNAVATGNVSMPGGRLDQPAQESTVGVRADITEPAQLARLPLSFLGTSNNQLHVGDVARIDDGYEDHRIISTLDNKDSVVIFVSRDSDSDTVQTTRSVRAEFLTLAEKYPPAALPRGGRRLRVHDAVDRRRPAKPRRRHPPDRDRAAAVPARLAQRRRRDGRDPGLAARDLLRFVALRVHDRRTVADGPLAHDRYPRRRLDRRHREHHAPSRDGAGGPRRPRSPAVPRSAAPRSRSRWSTSSSSRRSRSCRASSANT